MALFSASKSIVSQITVDIVNGFIKDAQLLLPNEDNPYYNIPELVNHICINFYNNPEYFSKWNERYFAMDKNQTGYSIKTGSAPEGSFYGNVDIVEDSFSKYTWKFNIISFRTLMAIGIDASNKKYIDKDFHDCGNTNPYYAIEVYREGEFLLYSHHDDEDTFRDEYGDIRKNKYIEGSEIIMELDLKKRTLSYYVDDEYLGVAFQDIYFKPDTKYNMTVFVSGVRVQLMDFSHVSSD